MSTALYRRYRSARFGDLVGQDVVATTLRRQVAGGNLAHAYLFTGIRGTGKTSTARILARAVNCASPADGEPCNACSACQEIVDGSSVDVLEIDAASNRGIDEMRDLREKVRYLPASLRVKVYIIDEAHMLTPEAWNAFLKTLEEPPPHVLFVLATTEPHKVPDTVRSRVQRFDFRRVPTPAIAGHLARVLDAEGVEALPAALDLLAQAAQGSIRDALSMTDQALAGGERPLTAAQARRALGVADPAIVHRLVQALAGADGAGALEAAAAALEAGGDPRQLLREAARLGRGAAFAALGHGGGADVSADERELVEALARVTPAGFWLRALELFNATELALRQPVDARLQVELCLMRLVHEVGAPDARVEELERRVALLESSGASGARAGAGAGARAAAPAAVAAPLAPAPAGPDRVPGVTAPSPPPAPAAEVRASRDSGGGSAAFSSVAGWEQSWQLLLEAANRRDVMLAGVLRDCRPLRASSDVLVVGVPFSFHLDRLRERPRLQVLGQVVSDVAGSTRAVELEFCGEQPPSRSARPGRTDDTTRAVLDAFAGSRVTSTRLRDEPRPAPGPAGA